MSTISYKKPPHPVDRHVGQRLRSRRIYLGLSQQALGAQVGVSFQQLQKYERASNRIGTSRLWQFAQVLQVSVEYFYHGYMQGAEETTDIPP